MTIFKVMDGSFGIDGLESKWAVFKAETADACVTWMIEQINAAPNPMELGLISIRWIEEHTDADDNYAAVWVELPYPQVKRIDMPGVAEALRARDAYFRSL